MADKKKIARNNTMYHSNTRQIRPNNTFHSNVSRANFKEFDMHPLTYHNNAIHNLKPFLERTKHNYNTGNVPMSQPDNSVHIPNADTVSQLLPNCKPDLSKIRYNNITKAITNETIQEHALTVNSYDRNFSFYKNPYSYTVRFNPMDKSIIKQSNGGTKTIPGDPKPHIKTDFDHIRYFKLELTILPTKLYNIIKTTDETVMTNFEVSVNCNSTYTDNETVTIDAKTLKIIHFENDGTDCAIEFLIIDGNEANCVYNWSKKGNNAVVKYKYTKIEIKDLTKTPFLTVNIEEINDINEYSTSDKINNCFNTLYQYQTRGEFSNYHTANVDKIFRFSELGNIKKLTISFRDHLGNILTMDNLNDANWVKNEPTDEYINGIISLKSPSVYIRHPLYSNYQNHILFKLGSIIPEIDKNVYC
jgi:hypothetical protein